MQVPHFNGVLRNMFIDIHAHCYRHPVPFGCRFCNPEELLKLYDEQEIERGFLLPVVSPEIYLPQSNEDILEICEAYPKRFIPFCNIDPRALTNAVDAPLYKVMEYYKERGCKGIGEIMPNMPMRQWRQISHRACLPTKDIHS